MVPKYIFLTKGVGRDPDKLTSFEMALRRAQIAKYNLVRVSSIYPPDCKVIGIDRGLEKLATGEIVYAVISENATNEPRRLMGASVGLAIPRDRSHHGYLSEYHSFGEKEQKVGDYAEDLAASMLATILGVPFDPDASWDEKRELWKISGEIVKTRNVTQTAIGQKDLWTTVIAAAILVPE